VTLAEVFLPDLAAVSVLILTLGTREMRLKVVKQTKTRRVKIVLQSLE